MTPEMETTEITCPDCGKVIAPAGQVEERRRCLCAEERERGRAVPSAVSGAPLQPQMETATQSKTCYVCGKDLTGRKRLKDHRGRYWCAECAAADDRLKQRENELRCPDCGRVFPDHKLMYFQADRVCHSCFKEREKRLERKIAKATGNKVQKAAEINKLMWMAIIVAALLGTAALFQFVL